MMSLIFFFFSLFSLRIKCFKLYSINNLREETDIFRFTEMENGDKLLITSKKTIFFRKEFDSTSNKYSYKRSTIQNFRGAVGTTNPEFDSKLNKFVVSGLKDTSTGESNLLNTISLSGNIEKVMGSNYSVENLHFHLSQVNDYEYLVSFFNENTLNMIKINTNSKKEVEQVSSYYGAYLPNAVDFKCHFFTQSETILCILAEIDFATPIQLFYYDKDFQLLDINNYPKIVLYVDKEVKLLEFLKMNEDVLVIMVSTVNSITISYATGTSESETFSQKFHQKESYQGSAGMAKLNENAFALYYSKDSQAEETGRDFFIKVLEVPSGEFIMSIINGETKTHYGILFLSFDKGKYSVLNHQSTVMNIFEGQFLADEPITLQYCKREEFTSLDLSNFSKEQVDPKRTYIVFRGLDFSQTDFLLEGVEKQSLTEEFVAVENFKHYNQLRYKYNTQKIPQFQFFIYNEANFMNIISKGFVEAKFVLGCEECYRSCKHCLAMGNSNDHKCTECKDSYYFLENTQNCYDKLDEHYLDRNSELFRKCHSHCLSCSKSGTELNTNCDSCKPEFIDVFQYKSDEKLKGNCTLPCDMDLNYWYIKDNNFFCTPKETKCPSQFPFLNTETNECQSKKTPEDSCIINFDDNSMENVKDFLYNYTEEIENIGTIIKEKYAFHINNKEPLSEKISNIDFEECEAILREKYNLDKQTKIYLGVFDIFEYQFNKVEYIVFSEGKELDLSFCSGINLTIYSKLKNLVQINPTFLNYTNNNHNFEGEVDIFNANSDFFNDYCEWYNSNNNTDVPIHERRKYYFQNITIKENCNVISVFLETWTITYRCPIYLNISQGTFESSVKINQFPKEIDDLPFKYFSCYHKFIVSFEDSNPGLFLCLIEVGLQLANVVYFFSISNKFTDGNPTLCNPPTREFPEKNSSEKTFNKKEQNKIVLYHNPLEDSYESLNESKKGILESPPKPKLKSSEKCLGKGNLLEMNEISIEIVDCTEGEEGKLIKRGYRVRTTFQNNFLKILRRKHYIYSTFLQKTPRLIRCIRFAIFGNFIITTLFFNAFFYCDFMISYNFESNSFSLLYEAFRTVTGFLCSYCVKCWFDRLTNNTYFIDKHNGVKKDFDRYLKIYKIRLVIGFVLLIFCHIVCTYYTVIFNNIYVNTRFYYILSLLGSLFLFITFPVLISGIVFTFGNMAIGYKSIFLYSISDFFK